MDQETYLNRHAVLLEELECRGVEIAEISFPVLKPSWNKWSDEKEWEIQIEEMGRVLKGISGW